ncbi:MAG: malonyl-ACP O-methyltransferase BioC [Gammaproteobacteria bacterium]|nr:malonyl-ACP O-methyltransferase BioC [Gammaproteobacteria bacterium]
MTQEFSPFDKQSVAASFSKAAVHYDEFAFVQREIGDRLIERLPFMKVSPKIVVDVGCGTGHFTRQLKQRYKKSKVFGCDIAGGMIQQAKSQQGWFNRIDYQVADMDWLPFADKSVDLIFSNLAVQWSVNPKHTFNELCRILKPGGLLLFSTLGPDTLIELKQAWSSVDEHTHVNNFLDMHDVGDFLIGSGLYDPVMDMEKLTFEYQSLKGLMKDLKGIGAHNLNHDRSRGLMTRSKWQTLENAYSAMKTKGGDYPATYEAVYGLAWGTENKKSMTSDVYKVSL